jgi:NAD(P)-dependent dehydrogenase (short-subunit alcohol dehydrogenase family)
MNRLKDKTAVITGGTSGIGLATAKLFAEEGATVLIASRDGDRLATAKRHIGDRAHAVQVDVTRPEDLLRLFGECERRFGGIDILMVNAAVVRLAPITDVGDDLFDTLVATNMKGGFNTLRHGVPVLRDGASVIVVTSWLNRIGFGGSSVASMTKAALRSLTRVAAAELASRNIRVNALSPGAITTPLWAKLGLPEETLEAAGAAITAQIPLQRWGAPEEVARAALFLASSDSSYVNGTELEVDGGLRQT